MALQKNKKGSSPWFQCEKCLIHVTNKDIDKHSSDCPPNSNSYNFIQNQVLFGTLDIKVNEEIKGVVDKDSLVFLSQSAIQLCGLSIGEWGLLEFEDLPPVAKVVWPTTEKSLTGVLLTKHAMKLCQGEVNQNVKVSTIPEQLSEAYRVTLVALNKPKSLEFTPELTNRLQKTFVEKIFCVNNRLSLMFFGKVLMFEIKSIESEQLADDFGNLTIKGSHFYKITTKTSWTLFSDYSDFKEKTLNNDLLSTIGGLDDEIADIKEAINACLSTKKSYGLKHCKSILLYGNSGTGKTLLARAISREFKTHIIEINASDLYSKYSGNVEETIKNLFDEAIEHAPTIIILDEIDILCPTRTQRMTDSEKRVSAMLLTMLDNLNSSSVFLLATTNKLESIDPVFRRFGRLEREIEISTPNPKNRQKILSKLLSQVVHNLSEADLGEIALNTHGFVGADLLALCSRAGLIASKREAEKITFDDFKAALKHVRPSAMREVQVEVANVRWGDIGGLQNLKLILRQAVEWPLRHPESFLRLGVTPPKGVLMFGPPGCSKTMIAKALATESGLNFLSIKGPELFSKWVGESEKAVREVFRKARQVAPSVIFFDEIDALGGERSSGSSTSVQERVLAQLLTELDGVSPLGDVTVLAATNRPDRIDKALLRPGRLDRIVYVPLPDDDTRREIFKLKLGKMPVCNVDVEELVRLTPGYSGAEVNAVCHEAAMMALEDSLDARFVEKRHFEKALTIVKPRTPDSLIQLYQDYLNKKI
ncbi:Transitional endoplasmic reticulum ATPase TER94-like Protein [Tribolium castaneum]|uniref:Transitional endoplasmic reticulum ATPase TER94-like Protein n=1 Tax=Tribolium castaneum TaxID=7070 RepID=D2A1M7_TRICA|nr:PREDICTED: spermatogenesis-associated protein 5 isoform X1 [Tribolium castaneum]EFA02694.2 Transitional endoplasmic reticulum ATPase TER94-like Protein [Tribolium castaneum]|eukprot:XP_008192807.1 PREDICTED: spermatogenesis-associated protein 5 isoform X1 [Tribolium castaneum]